MRLGFLLGLVCLGAIGCGGSVSTPYPTEGKVLSKGQPAVGATVTLYPRSEEMPKVYPTGIVGPDGNFCLTTRSNNDGAVPGEYDVVITWTESYKEDGETFSSPDKFNGLYGNPKTTTLRAKVEGKKTVLPTFDLP